MEMPLLGLGTWGMGGFMERDPATYTSSLQALYTGLKIGFRLIDTAEIYGNGLTEEIVGEAIKEYARAELFITSKVWKEHLSYDGVIAAAEGSLRRLGIEYLDLCLIHWPNEAFPLSETLRAMERLVTEGFVRQIGVSNFSVALMEETKKYLSSVPIYANQVQYNLVTRPPEPNFLDYCRENNIHVMAYRPLAKGVLGVDAPEAVKKMAKKYQKTPAQVALNWLVTQGITAIPKAGSPKHLEENWGALGWSMEAADVELLNKTKF